MFSQRWSPRPRRVRPNLLRFSVHLSLGSWPPSSIAISFESTMAQLRALVHSHNDPPHPHDTRTPRADGCRLRGAALRAGLGRGRTSPEPHRPAPRLEPHIFPGDPVDGTLGGVMGDLQADIILGYWGGEWMAASRSAEGECAARGRRRAYGQAEAIGCTRLPTMPSKRRSRRIRPSPPRRGAAGSCWGKCK